MGKGAESVEDPEGLEDSKETRSSKLPEQNSYELRESEAAGTRPAWVCTTSFSFAL